MLTLDEPDPLTLDRHQAGQASWTAYGVLPVEHLFMAMRARWYHPPRSLAALDPDPLYQTHGDPRD